MANASRFPFIDRTRGLIMLFMALDHALYFWSYGRISNEGLPVYAQGHLTFIGANNPSVLAYLVMLLSSICAPGFFFIAGYVMALSVKHREEAGVPSSEINKHLALRGIGLIALQVLVASPAFNLPLIEGKETALLSSGFIISLSVLSTIGLCIFFLILARHLSPWKLVGISASLYLLGEIVLSRFAKLFPQLPLWEKSLQTLLVLPVPFASEYVLNNNFPIIPWLFPICLGWFYGYTFSPERGIHLESKRFLISGFASLGLFLVLRLMGLGDYLKAGTLNRFLVLSKYPPSPDYFLIIFRYTFYFIFFVYPVA